MSAKRIPKIWIVSSSLTTLLSEILPDYADAANIRVIHKLFAEGEQAARDMLLAGEADVFIAAGANGAYLRNRLSAPVVQIKVSGFDVLQALTKARKISERIAIFSYQTISAELEEVKELLRLDIEQCFYTTPEDARERIRQLASDGIRVVVGSSMVNRLAAEAGMDGIYLYSGSALRRSIDDAIEIARVARIEESRREWLDAVLHHLNEAVVAVDREGVIRSLNPAFARLASTSEKWARGRKLPEVAPGFDLDNVLRTGQEELEKIQRVGAKTYITNRFPLREQGELTGAVLSCQDASVIQRADRSLRVQNRPRNFTARHTLERILGDSPALQQARKVAAQYAKADSTVLIVGETGTGKELFAQGIHNASRRAAGAFVAFNCAAFAENLLESELFGYEDGAFTGTRKGGKAGLIECAHQGSLFLDEIGEMPPSLQSKLLRVLQEREVLRLGATETTPVDVRIFAATHRDLRQMVMEGDFREDLFYRLNILNLHLPPLRERSGDINRLAGYFLGRKGGEGRDELLNSILPYLERYNWPGNIRELENVIERIAVFSADGTPLDGIEGLLQRIIPELFPDGSATACTDLRLANRSRDLEHVRKVLAECGGDQVATAKRLGISRTTLWRKLKA